MIKILKIEAKTIKELTNLDREVQQQEQMSGRRQEKFKQNQNN